MFLLYPFIGLVSNQTYHPEWSTFLIQCKKKKERKSTSSPNLINSTIQPVRPKSLNFNKWRSRVGVGQKKEWPRTFFPPSFTQTSLRGQGRTLLLVHRHISLVFVKWAAQAAHVATKPTRIPPGAPEGQSDSAEESAQQDGSCAGKKKKNQAVKTTVSI